MTKITTILAFTILILFQSCEIINDCEDIACFTPPQSFEFEFIDKESKENLFTNQQFDANDIKIINNDDDSSVEFIFISENNYNTISINSIGWKTETINYSILIKSEEILDLHVKAERKDGNCCQYTEYKEIRIENAEYDKKGNFYKILID